MKQATFIAIAMLVVGGSHAAEHRVQLIQKDGTVQIELSEKTTLADSTTVSIEDTIVITCTNVLCGTVKAKIGEKPLPLSGDDAEVSGTITADLLPAEAKLTITPPGASFTLKPAGIKSNSGSALGSYGDLVKTCPNEFKPYDGSGNRARFLVTTGGSIVVHAVEPIDENDIVEVWVLGPEQVLSNLEVRRSSTTRTGGTIYILGEEAGKVELAPQAAADLQCRQFELGNFAPGTGAVELYTMDQQKKVLGSFEFTVNRLAHGVLSFGPVVSDVIDQTYTLVPDGEKKRIVSEVAGDRAVQYTIQYTHYWKGPRDPEKREPASDLGARINPTIGFAIDDLEDHVIVGLSYDIGHVLISAGVHFGRVQTLNTSTGLSVGGAFTGQASEIPTVKEWESGFFCGISLDLRAASKLLGAILGGSN